jgi:hypothetical protein
MARNKEITIADEAPQMPQGLSPMQQKQWLVSAEQEERMKRANENFHERDAGGRLTYDAMQTIIKGGMSVIGTRTTGIDADGKPVTQGVSMTRLEHLPSPIQLVSDDVDAQARLLESYEKRKEQLDADIQTLKSFKGKSNPASGRKFASVATGSTSPSPLASLNPVNQNPEGTSNPNLGPSAPFITNPGEQMSLPHQQTESLSRGGEYSADNQKGQQGQAGLPVTGGNESDDLDNQLVEGKPLSFWDGKSDSDILKIDGINKVKLKSIKKAQRERNAMREELEARQEEGEE